MAFNIDFHAKFGSKVAWIWRKLALFFRVTAHQVDFFTCASGAVSLTMAQVPTAAAA